MDHLRVDNGRHDIDAVIDVGRGRLFCIEFKAVAAPLRKDARHLM